MRTRCPGIDNIEGNASLLLEEEPHHHSLSINLMNPNTQLPHLSRLEGYKYTGFNPTPINPNIDSYMRVSQTDALAALEDLKKPHIPVTSHL
jgi:hypothetical protein